MPKYEFNDNEVAVMKQMLDLAVKAGGMQVAEAGLVLMKKLATPIVEPEPPKAEDKKDK